jgi:hypothetical protein
VEEDFRNGILSLKKQEMLLGEIIGKGGIKGGMTTRGRMEGVAHGEVMAHGVGQEQMTPRSITKHLTNAIITNAMTASTNAMTANIEEGVTAVVQGGELDLSKESELVSKGSELAWKGSQAKESELAWKGAITTRGDFAAGGMTTPVPAGFHATKTPRSNNEIHAKLKALEKEFHSRVF